MQNPAALAIYLVPFVLIMGIYLMRARIAQRNSLSTKAKALADGMTEPASLHPLINPRLCIGCGSCVEACPEHRVLGLINKKAELVGPSHCIGHGACKTACPVNAITLVFGTERRGFEIPELTEDFETTLKGVYIAGELGGMGLIRNAIEQGKQAMAAIKRNHLQQASKSDTVLDTLIVGAGPSGISASLFAKENGLSYQTIEQDTLGGTVAHFPRGKLVMTAPATLPLVGDVTFRETSKEELLSFWQDIEQKYQLNISYQEALTGLSQEGDLLRVQTNRGEYLARSVLLAIGRRGSPRKLGIDGEEGNKVTYRMIDPEQYRGKHVLVVGGGDSALEAACSIAEAGGESVTLSYRGEAFSRAKEKNRNNVAQAQDEQKIAVLLQSDIVRINEESVDIKHEQTVQSIPNDNVIVCAGGVLPTGMLKSMGIEVAIKHGTL